MNIKNLYLVLLAIACLTVACDSRGQARGRGATPAGSAVPLQTESIPAVTPVINVYIENSGSMDGYVRGVTEFEQAVYNYLSDIKISGVADSLNLFYINSKVIPQGSGSDIAVIEDFILKLEPSSFSQKGGGESRHIRYCQCYKRCLIRHEG
ncbi:MAG: hypothetical protein LBT42_07175 [Tannerella sp.]|nr:hypothetical protein [Tannerella sp.]